MTKEQFIKAIKVLTTTYDKEFNQEQVEIWYSFFVNDSYELFKKAIKNIIVTKKYFPSVAEIKEEIALLQTKDIPKAEDEWEEVLKAVHRYGSYRREEALESLKPYTAYITRHIGYNNICMAEDQTWNKKEFIGEYNALKDKEIENLQIGSEERVFLENSIKMIEGE